MDTARASWPLWVRLLLLAGLVVVAALALPLSALLVEAVSTRADNWILVVYLAAVVLLGALVGMLLPASSSAPTRGGRSARWAAAGLLAALAASGIWMLLLTG